MASNERIVSTVLHVVESKESLERSKADLEVSEETVLEHLLSKYGKKRRKNEEKDEDSERDD